MRFICLVLGLMFCSHLLANDEWQLYKQRFVSAEGRVVDSGNQGISHSEGQGYGMLLATAHDDKESFQAMWRWARKVLGRHDLPLFAWKYDPNAMPNIVDNNNATDGDILIAWALLNAGRKWHNSNYLNASRRIRNAVLNEVVHQYAGHWVLMPGLKGFHGNGYVDINLSYWVMPALQDFAVTDNQPRWQQLFDSGIALLSQAQFGDAQLPADWTRLTDAGKLFPAPTWPKRFSFDAVRIGLYFAWAGQRQNAALTPIKQYWQAVDGIPPAWMDVVSGEVAPYGASSGMLAIRQLLENKQISQTLTDKDDYYSASLLLLSKLAQAEITR